MEYTYIKSEDILEVSILGKLTFRDQKKFQQMIDELIAAAALKWRIDLRPIPYIDSAGLGLLLRIKDNAEQADISASLHLPESGQVRHMFNISHFEKLFTVE